MVAGTVASRFWLVWSQVRIIEARRQSGTLK